MKIYLIYKYSSLAQSVEHSAVNRVVVGSSPTGGVWLLGQAVKTSPFHGGNTGSIPVGVIWEADYRSTYLKAVC